MSDLKKAIKGLEEISDYFFNVYHHSKDREEINEAKDRCDAVEDAIALLKKQETTGHWVSVNDGDTVAIDNDGFPERACYCSECQKYLIASDEYAVYGRYCPFCGSKMEGR